MTEDTVKGLQTQLYAYKSVAGSGETILIIFCDLPQDTGHRPAKNAYFLDAHQFFFIKPWAQSCGTTNL